MIVTKNCSCNYSIYNVGKAPLRHDVQEGDATMLTNALLPGPQNGFVA